MTLLDHPLAAFDSTTLETASDYPFVGYFPRHSYEAFSSLAQASLSRPLNVRIEVSNYEARCRLIRENAGIGVMPELIAASCLTRYGLKAIRLIDDRARRQFFPCMSVGDRRTLRPAVMEFVDCLLVR